MQNSGSQGKQGLDKPISDKKQDFFRQTDENAPKVAVSRSVRVGRLAFNFGQVLFVVALFSLYAGFKAPDVNESHYLTKAKHFWDQNFCVGDIFLESRDAHWFFFATFGGLTHWLSLPMAAWVGRLIGWFGLAIGWCRFLDAFSVRSRMLVPGATCLWIAGMHWGHLSGEWVVGGCEAKVFAYAFCLIGLSEVVAERWSRSWVWFGLASAFHVVSGGWIVLTALIAFAFRRSRVSGQLLPYDQRIRSQLIPLIAGGSLAMLGLIPALLLNRGVDSQTVEQGFVIYVYQRLSHHLSPLHFAAFRWCSYAALVSLTCCVLALFRFYYRRGAAMQNGSKPLMILFELTIGATLLAALGLLIDVTLSGWATNWAAGLLRFYWFRWNDVLWPTLLAVTTLLLADGAVSQSDRRGEWVRWSSIVLLILPGSWLLWNRCSRNLATPLPPADSAIAFQRVSSVEQKRIRNDWLDICYWIRGNTPENSLFLTPRFQQTFKWYAHRAEIACWKDAPQDAVGLIEWEKRMLAIFPRDTHGYGIAMTDEHLRAMFRQYRMNYVVLDRRLQKKPPLLPLVHMNTTYAVFEVPFDATTFENANQPP